MANRRVLAARVLNRTGLLRAILEARGRGFLPRRWLTVLTYHRVVVPEGALGFDPDVIDADPASFDAQVALLARHFTFVDTRDLVAYAQGAPLPENPVMVTFDDGYRDNHDVVLPILLRHGAKAVFFVATRFIAERRLFWWERIAQLIGGARVARLRLERFEGMDLPLGDAAERGHATAHLLRLVKTRYGLDVDLLLEELAVACGTRDEADARAHAERLLMNWDHIRALRDAGMDVQSHSHAHRLLQTMSPAEAARDLLLARQTLERELDRPVHAIAYPAGSGLSRAPDMRGTISATGHRLGFSCGDGIARLDRSLDLLDVPRVSMDRALGEEYFRGILAIPALAY